MLLPDEDLFEDLFFNDLEREGNLGVCFLDWDFDIFEFCREFFLEYDGEDCRWVDCFLKVLCVVNFLL